MRRNINVWQANSSIIISTEKNDECFMSILTKIFMIELRIFKLHRKTILQQTPSSGTPISFFFHDRLLDRLQS